MSGTVEVNSVNESGTLLTGKILQFGYQYNSGTSTAEFDFRFQLTGGLFASLPAFAGMDIGVTMDSENSTTFTGSFQTDFTGVHREGWPDNAFAGLHPRLQVRRPQRQRCR